MVGLVSVVDTAGTAVTADWWEQQQEGASDSNDSGSNNGIKSRSSGGRDCSSGVATIEGTGTVMAATAIVVAEVSGSAGLTRSTMIRAGCCGTNGGAAV